MEDANEFLEELLGKFSETYQPALSQADANLFLSTSEIINILNEMIDVSAQESQIPLKLRKLGYDNVMVKGKFRWMIRSPLF